MAKIAVCDDDSQIRDLMSSYLSSYDSFIHVDFYSSGEELLDAEISYDILFLDIDMKGITGIDTARKLRAVDKRVKIIYITAYDDFRDYAFGVHAFGYLVKPFDKNDILNILKEAQDYSLKEQLGPKIRFQAEQGILDLEISEIYYLEYVNRKVHLITQNGIFTLRGPISDFAAQLVEMGFSVPHKSFVVNLSHIRSLKGYDIFLDNGSIIPLSQKKSASFREYFTRWLARQI